MPAIGLRFWSRKHGDDVRPEVRARFDRARSIFAEYLRAIQQLAGLTATITTTGRTETPSIQSALVVIAVEHLLSHTAEELAARRLNPIRFLIHRMLTQLGTLPVYEDVATLLELFIASPVTWLPQSSVEEMAELLKRTSDGRPLSEETTARVRRLIATAAGRQLDTRQRAALETLTRLLPEELAKRELLDITDDWGAAANDALAPLDAETAAAWRDLLIHASHAVGTAPSEPWLQSARDKMATFGEERFAKLAADWLLLLRRPASGRTRTSSGGETVSAAMLTSQNSTILKGIAWMCGTLNDQALTLALGDAAAVCLTRVGRGARSSAGGKGCIHALTSILSDDAVAQLVRLQQRVTQKETLKLIERGLREAATRSETTSDELADRTVPTFDLVDGRIRRSAGAFTAEIAVERGKASVRWLDADDTRRKSVPTEIKRDHAETLTELTQTAKDIQAMLGAQRLRLERLYLMPRDWNYLEWREWLLDHPLLALLTRRLIWSFTSGAGMTLGCWLNGRIVGLDDQPIPPPAPGDRIGLFHPVQADPATIHAWQLWLERHQITQPFKQAHREIYPLTDAELATEHYSLRYGGHILHANQFAGLCKQRGWTFNAYYARQATAALAIKGSGLRAHLVHERDATARDFSTQGNDRFVTTGRVTFARGQSARAEAVRLDAVPPMLFSEVMRDVDLFVGVCSIGADPTWQDRPVTDAPRFLNYVRERSMEELNQAAQGRRELLARLLPSLGLTARCTLDDRYVIVRGDLRTYKIHLGSGNILMEPDHKYLCIVPQRRGDDAADRIYLPFEGDATLSLILSKAMLLARDTAIKDPTITRQIKR